jgi:RNA polymerase sigma-70 factor, ECF subfamily
MQDGSDDDLMRLAGSGDRPAFSRLVARHLRRATGVAGRISGNRADAEEIVQEAFLRAWQKAPDWKAQADRPEGAAFSTWFYRVLVNLCIDRKRKPRTDPIEAASEVADESKDGFDVTHSAEVGKRVAAAVETLPDRQRAALVLCHYEGVTNIDAARILDISVGALESLLVRARRTLRDALADMAGEYSPAKGAVS